MGSIGPAGRTAQPSDFGLRVPIRCLRRSAAGTSKSNTARKPELAGPSCGLNAIRAGPPTGLTQGKNLDETLKQELLGRFATYLDAIEPSEAEVDAAGEGREEADLFSIFVELAGLRNETRAQSRLVKEAIDRFRDVIDIRDRLAAGLKPAATAVPRWYERFLANRQRETAEAWREGLRMTLRRIDALLADRDVADGIVVEDVRPGFLWQGELLRLAEVVVAKRNA